MSELYPSVGSTAWRPLRRVRH